MHRLTARACAWLLGLALGLALPSTARVQTIDPKPWAVNTYGRVISIARSPTTIYLGGNFSAVGPVTGQGVPVNRTTGQPLADYPVVSGTIKAVLADGRGGWYIGGAITRVGGEARSALAHIGADGQVTPWAPAVAGVVQVMALSGDTLFVGGGFTAVAGESRGRGAAFDVRTGALLAWDPLADGDVLALAVDGADVFLGGRFGNLGTAARPRVGAVERELGNATGWSPQVVAGKVEALAVRGNEVYVGGEYDESHAVLAAVERTTGAVLPYDWAVAERRPACDRCGYVPFVQALVIAEGRLYIAGSFTHIGGEARLGMASVDLATQKVTAWNPLIYGPAPLPYCFALAVHDGVAYVGGQFYGLGVAGHDYVGAVDAVSGASLGWYPRPDADVHALAVSAAAVYVGGEFSSMWAWQRRNHLAALDAQTGALLPWDPDPDFVVGCMALSGNTLYVSGSFRRVGGQPRAAIAALDATTGLATEWNPGVTGYTSGPVWAMKLHRGTLYVGGYFSQIGGQARYCLAAIDSASGEVTAWNPGVDDIVEAIEVRGDTLYLAGWFSEVGGQPRSYLAAVNTSGGLLHWDPRPNSVVRSIALGESLVYVAGWFTQIGGQPRTQLAALDPAHGTATAWVADANDRVVSIVVANGVLYAGGWFTTIGGKARQGLAAVSTDSARVLDWGPSLNGRALELLPSGDAIYVGGIYQHIAGAPRPGFAILSQYGVDWSTPPPAPPDRAALAQNVPNPARASTSVRFALARGGAVTLTLHDLAGRRIARPIRDEWREPGVHAVEIATGTWPPGIYHYRLSAPGVDITRKMAVVR